MRTSTILVIVLALVGGSAAPLHARTQCQATPQGTLCTSEVDFQQFAQQAFMSQLQSQWCWAASISMIFAYHGHPVSQARIVSDVYGGPENLPAMAGITIARQLDRCWDDDVGASFDSRVTAAFDHDAGVYAITNAQIVNELDQGRPMVIGARTHAMVLTMVQWFQTPNGPNIVGGGVFDPWPGIGPRPLQPDELYPVHVGGSLRFLATVHIIERGDACPLVPDGGFDPGGCQASRTRHAGWLAVLVLGLVLTTGRRRRAQGEPSA